MCRGKFLFLAFIYSFTGLVFGGIEKIENVCIPKISNFDKASFNTSNQVWAIAQNAKGYLYYATPAGLMEFDGSQWSFYKPPYGDSMIRSIIITSDQKIYSGGQNEFGFWAEDPITRKLKYTSLTTRFNLKLHEEGIWRIIESNNEIYFRSYRNIYRYNRKNETVSIISAPHRFQFIFRVNRRVFVQEKVLGLLEIKNSKLIPIAGGNTLTGDCVYGMEMIDPQRILIATIDKGLYELAGDKVVKSTLACNEYLVKNQVFSMCALPNGNFAFGTILNGVLITDRRGNIISIINKQKGLANNTVLSLLADMRGNLWLGLDKGISHININSPVRYYPDPNGLLGSVYDVQEFKGQLYLATNQGVYTCPIANLNAPDREFRYNLLPNSQGQAWNLQVMDNQLFCCHNKGIFIIDGNKMTNIFKESGVTRLLQVNHDIAAFSSYEGLYILRRKGSGFEYTKFQEYAYFGFFLAKDKNNTIYTGNNSIGIVQLHFDADFRKVISHSNELDRIGIQRSSLRGIFSNGNRLYLVDKSGIKLFDEQQNRFVPDPLLTRLIPPKAEINQIGFTGEDMWCFGPDQFFCIHNYESPNAHVVTRNMETLFSQMVNRNENVIKLAPEKYLVCTSSSFSVLNTAPSACSKQSLKVFFRDIGTFTDSMSASSLTHPLSYYATKAIEFPNNHPTIYVRFTLPYYQSVEKVRYSYRFKGTNESFSIPSQSSTITFPHLPSGDYVLQVKATIEGTDEVYYSDDLRITILPPWYLGWMGYVLFLILLASGIYLFNYYLKMRLKRQQIRIANEHEKEMSKKDNKILQEKVELQNQELLRITKTMLRKNKLMNKLDEEILRISETKAIPALNIKNLKQIVEMNKNPEEEWKIFEMSFNNTYDNYLVRLSSKYPSLTNSDLKLAAYIRMNISSKEIASLLNISLKSIEMARYRLRKKMNIEHEQNLTAFLMSI